MGKLAIYLCGSTQLLFGISGNRQDTLYSEFTTKFVNKHWVRPQTDQTPTWAKEFNNKSYW
jgi:hypothetical protein